MKGQRKASPSPDDPGYWLPFLAGQIATFGAENNHSSYRNPGRAHELVTRWANLAGEVGPDPEQVRQLFAEINRETEQQEVPVHSMWNEIRRGFVTWARAAGYRDAGE